MSCCIIDLSFPNELYNKQIDKIIVSALSGCRLIGNLSTWNLEDKIPKAFSTILRSLT